MRHDSTPAVVNALRAEYVARTAHRPAPPPNVRVDWYNITNSTDSTEIMLYSAIGGHFGVDASDFATELRAVTAPRINLHINSSGGDVFDGAAIYTALENHPATVTAYVDGVAAEAASFVAMAADRIVMSRAATMMVRDGSCLTYGNRDDHAVSASLLDKLSNTIAGLYAHRAGGTVAEWRERMLHNNGNGTWYTAKEAIAARLADELDEPDPEKKPQDTATNDLVWALLARQLMP